MGNLFKKNKNIYERLIEWSIYGVSSLSIIFIFLILGFIFKEASPIFFGGSDTKTHTTQKVESNLQGNQNLEVEEYNPEAGDVSQKTTTADNGNEVEEYNPEVTLNTANSVISDKIVGDNQAAASEHPDSIARRIIGYDYPILTHDSPVSVGNLMYRNWQPNSEFPRYGIYPILLGTLKTTILAVLISAPLGILAAVFTSLFAKRRTREWLKPLIETLAAFPSVVMGFFCLMVVASFVQSVFGLEIRLNAVVGGIGLALVSLPIIFTITDDALSSVPQSLKEGALALGATNWETVYKVMLPAATPGIIAGVILGIGRAMGETMIVLMATGNAGDMSLSFFESVRTMSATIGAEMGEVVFGSGHYQVLFLLGFVLLIFSLILNMITEFYVKQKLVKKFRG